MDKTIIKTKNGYEWHIEGWFNCLLTKEEVKEIKRLSKNKAMVEKGETCERAQ